MPRFLIILILVFLSVVTNTAIATEEVNVYSARKEALIKPLLDSFTQQTGIKVNLVTGKADALLKRLITEGINTPADLFLTVDAGRLYRAKQAKVLHAISSRALLAAVPESYRDSDGYWYGLSLRARVIAFSNERVNSTDLFSYEGLADLKWKKRLCIRSSDNIYNQSLVASMIVANGETETEKWAKGLVKNMARKPKGGDRDQIKAIAAGQCDVALINDYYYKQMLNAKDETAVQAAANKVTLFWPNQQGRGAHVNISGVGITAHAKNKQAATKLLLYLLSDDAQHWYSEINYEYSVRESLNMLNNDGIHNQSNDFKADNVNMEKLGSNNSRAVMLMDRANWR